MYRCFHIPVVTASLLCFFTAISASAGPSAKLTGILSMQMPATRPMGTGISGRLQPILWSMRNHGVGERVSIGIERVEGYTIYQANGETPAGTFRQQLDRIAELSYTKWEANGDWINFIPSRVVDDPNYIMNQHIPGRVVVSKDPRLATSVKGWLKEKGIVSLANAGGLEFGDSVVIGASKPENPIVLENPCLREYYNAYATLYGDDSWSVSVRTVTAKGGDSSEPTVITYSSDNSRRVLRTK